MHEMEDWFSSAGVIAVIAAPLVWFGSQMVLAVIVRPYRQKLSDGLAYLKAHSSLNEAENFTLDQMWGTAFGPRAAIILSIAYLEGLVMSRDAIRRERNSHADLYPNFWADPRFDDLMDWYFASIFAANPLFGLVALVLRYAWRAKVVLMFQSDTGTSRDQRDFVAMPPFEAAVRT